MLLKNKYDIEFLFFLFMNEEKIIFDYYEQKGKLDSNSLDFNNPFYYQKDTGFEKEHITISPTKRNMVLLDKLADKDYIILDVPRYNSNTLKINKKTISFFDDLTLKDIFKYDLNFDIYLFNIVKTKCKRHLFNNKSISSNNLFKSTKSLLKDRLLFADNIMIKDNGEILSMVTKELVLVNRHPNVVMKDKDDLDYLNLEHKIKHIREEYCKLRNNQVDDYVSKFTKSKFKKFFNICVKYNLTKLKLYNHEEHLKKIEKFNEELELILLDKINEDLNENVFRFFNHHKGKVTIVNTELVIVNDKKDIITNLDIRNVLEEKDTDKSSVSLHIYNKSNENFSLRLCIYVPDIDATSNVFYSLVDIEEFVLNPFEKDIYNNSTYLPYGSFIELTIS